MEGIFVDKNSLCFMIPKEGMISSEKVQVSNFSEEAVVFRVKTTDRYRFNVRPRNGIIQPQASLEIDIVFNGFTEDTRVPAPRLRLDVAPLPPKAIGIEAKEFWRTRDAIFKKGESNTLSSYPLFKYYFNVKLIEFNQSNSNSLTQENDVSLKSINGLRADCCSGDEAEYDARGEDVIRVGRKTIVFPCSPRGTCSADDILLENHSTEPMTFRVRSTDPKIFLAKPNNGLISANDSIDITCIYNGLNSTKKQRSFSHYFQVDVTNSVPNNASRFWAAFDMNLIQTTVYTLLFQVEFQQDGNAAVQSGFAFDDSPSFFNITRSFKNLKLERTSRAAPPTAVRNNSNVGGTPERNSLARMSLMEAPRSRTTDLVRVPYQKDVYSPTQTRPRKSNVKIVPFYEKDGPHPNGKPTMQDDMRPSFASRVFNRDSHSHSRAVLNYSPRSRTTDLLSRYDTDIPPSHVSHADARRSMSVRLNDTPSSLGSGFGLHRTPNHHFHHIEHDSSQAERKPSTSRKSSSKRFRHSLGDAWNSWRRR